MSDFGLVEIDSLEATVIIDNELDPLSPVAPDTVHVSGLMGNLAKCSRNTLDDRGPACKELRMDNICCSAHGLSILVVRVSHGYIWMRSNLYSRQPRKEISNAPSFSMQDPTRMPGSETSNGCIRNFAP